VQQVTKKPYITTNLPQYIESAYVQHVQQFNLSSQMTFRTWEDSGSTEATIMMLKYFIMAVARILQPAITEIAVDIGYAGSRLFPSIITSILWVLILLVVTEHRRRNATK